MKNTIKKEMEIEVLQRMKKIKINKEFLKEKIARLKKIIIPPPKKVSIYLVNNRTIKSLNKKFLKKNGFTDVISFKYSKNSGELIISLEECMKNAEIYSHTLEEEVLYVIIHGILHLKGYRDYNEKERKEMFSLQDKVFNMII
jgi:probable rRNA maturation factor